MLTKARIKVTDQEADVMEVADFGLNDLRHIGAQIIVYENNDRYCAKEIILFPRQAIPEHYHPPVSSTNIGKQETFRVRWGEMFLYVPGDPTPKPRAVVPPQHRPHITVWHELRLRPGDQYTLPPNTRHWFQAGPAGAIVSEFSSASTDDNDIFTDPRIQRTPVIES
jgi:D-lyxose ketol-isomerase